MVKTLAFADLTGLGGIVFRGRSSVWAMGLLISALTATGASAAAITVNNFSFEMPNEGTSNSSNDVVSDWTASGSGIGGTNAFGVYAPVNPTQYQKGTDGLGPLPGLIVPDGSQAGYIQGIVTLSQATGANIADNTTYTLSVWVGERDDPGFNFPSSVDIELTANGVAIGGSATEAVSAPGEGQWVDDILTYTTTTGVGDPFLGDTLGIALVDNSSFYQVNFDDVTLSCSAAACNDPPTGVPEPATLAILGAGIFCLGMLRRRKMRTRRSSAEFPANF